MKFSRQALWIVFALVLGGSSMIGCGKDVDLTDTDATCQRARAAGAGECSVSKDLLIKGEADARRALEASEEGKSDKAQELAANALGFCQEAEKLAQSDQCRQESKSNAGGDALDFGSIDDEQLVEQLKSLSVAEVVGKLQTAYFEFDRSSLTSEAKKVLGDNARVLKARQDIDVIISGHCDERGTDEYNRALGARRAETVKSYLADAGVGVSRMKTVSYGEDEPVDSGHSEYAWTKNRRAEFSLR